MTTRYYKATDGTFTIFRSTESREYRSAWIEVDGFKTRPRVFGFSSYPAHTLRATGAYEAIEIDKPEYEGLVEIKLERSKDGAPSNSWVRNADIPTGDTILRVRIVGLEDEEPERFEEAAPRVVQADPTKTTYLNLTQAYEILNAKLWGGKLPWCLVTLQRKANTRGYFAGARFTTRDGKSMTDEIALNPSTFKERDTWSILSTLAHEMCHLEQHHFGKPGKGGYHNKEWGGMMHAIGLTPMSIDQPGKEVGSKVTHTIDLGGRFDVVAKELIEQGVAVDYVEAWTEEGQKKAKAKAASKTKYSCPQCGTNAWAKPDTHLICGDCDEAMEGEGS